MELLLHICCAVCLIYPFKVLKEKGFKIKGFFYNPNIHPFSEYLHRKEALIVLNDELKLDIIYPEYKPQEFFRKVNFNEEDKKRCWLCWQLRLENTADFALKNGFNFFSTTLLVSPYQDQEKIKELADRISQEKGINFYYQDFRPGFRQAHKEAKERGLYCQKYCGCIYSEVERWKHLVKS
jgi:predicted adenine nucleotide alpha hydrolase (AANH) superfamily ATPase